MKRPIYLFELHQRATTFPFQLFKPTGGRFLSPTASHRPNSTLQLNEMEPSTILLALFFSKPPTRPRNLKSTQQPRGPITIHPARRSIAAEDRRPSGRNELGQEETPEQVRDKSRPWQNGKPPPFMPAVLRRRTHHLEWDHDPSCGGMITQPATSDPMWILSRGPAS